MKRYYWRILILVFISVLFYAWVQSRDRVNSNDFIQPEIRLFLHEKEDVISLTLEDYIIGTVAGEMPASFELEALKAQAVCARTYALRKLIDKQPYPLGADLSDDINVCQAFRDIQSEDSGLNQQNIDRVRKAVEATRGEIMIYQSQPIDALYHSCCGGRTDSSWGNASNIPYLRSVKCDYCQDSGHFCEISQFNNETINRLVGDHGNKLEIKIISRSPGGRVNQLSINGKPIYAANMRQQLNLPSQWMSFRIHDKQTEITTHGYGHGIGMCQYGANGLAKQGKDYQQILKKYYHDVDIYKLPY